MERFIITAESTADLPANRLSALHIPTARVFCSVSGGPSGEDGPDGWLAHAVSDAMRGGGRASTALIGTARYESFFSPFLAAGYDVLHLAVSSGLSGCCGCACLAAASLGARFPARRVLVVDTLAVSGGQGLLVARTAAQRNRGYSLTACRDYAVGLRASVQHLITAEGSMALLQGGRMAAPLSSFGTGVSVKPVLELAADGRLVLRERANGRLSSMRALVRRFVRAYDERLNEKILLVHADCPADAKKLAAMLQSALPTHASSASAFAAPEIESVCAGAASCTHIGPGGLGLFFRGHGRY